MNWIWLWLIHSRAISHNLFSFLSFSISIACQLCGGNLALPNTSLHTFHTYLWIGLSTCAVVSPGFFFYRMHWNRDIGEQQQTGCWEAFLFNMNIYLSLTYHFKILFCCCCFFFTVYIHWLIIALWSIIHIWSVNFIIIIFFH